MLYFHCGVTLNSRNHAKALPYIPILNKLYRNTVV